MAETILKSRTRGRLSELLAQPGTWSLRDRLVLVRNLAERVQTLHGQGRTHRAIRAESVNVDDGLRPRLDPPALPERFGGEGADPEQCPPELVAGEAVVLPEGIEAAAAVLTKGGHSIDPRQIDIYQIGTLLCRLLTGETILGYMYDPKIKAKVPSAARGALGRALGEDEAGLFGDCDELIEALDKAVQAAEPTRPPAAQRDTPAEGSILLAGGDTPPDGHRPVPESPDVVSLPPQLGHYRILDRIGGGGMGDVYRGHDESLDREVAIKVLPPELARDQDFVKRFHQEATAAAKLKHPNVVPIYYCGNDGGHHYFAMQFVEGESLAQRLRRQGRLTLDETLTIVEQCLAGLESAHARELIHRDIKPGNILIERESGRAVIVDFGLVRRMGSQERMTATGMVMGTVDYLAPEQARGQTVDGRADIYSLGVLCYQLLSGRLPFEADTPTAMIFQHAYEDPFPLSQAAPDLPPAVYEIVDRMMAKDPAKRYATCADVQADIRAFREDRPLAPVASADRSRSRETSDPKSDDSGYDGGAATSDLPEAEDIDLPSDLDELADNSPLRRVRDWAATMFRRHAPEFVQNLQSTTQQVDGAVAHYERRCQRLAKLLEEARGIEADLAQQQSANETAAAEAESAAEDGSSQAAMEKKQECDEQLVAVRTQLDQQREQVEQLESELAKADATLARLRSQRDALNARLASAKTGQRSVEDVVREKRRRLRVAAIAIGVAMAGILAVLVVFAFLSARTPYVESGIPQPDFAVASFDAGQAQEHQEKWAAHLGVPVEYTNSIGMKFRLIPPGEFLMGSPDTERQTALEEVSDHEDKIAKQTARKIPNEGPQHSVKISRPFYLGKYEVTQEQWQDVMGNEPSQFKDRTNPVETVNWGDVQSFLAKLNDQFAIDGMKFVLPTEAQWEYACRAGTATAYCFGDDAAGLGKYGWYQENSGGNPHPVGEKSPNAWGLHDMHGNVWEWCSDRYGPGYYGQSPPADPTGPSTGLHRANRGGGITASAGNCRSARRNGCGPIDRVAGLGFRVALVPAGASRDSFRQLSRGRTSTAINRAEPSRAEEESSANSAGNESSVRRRQFRLSVQEHWPLSVNVTKGTRVRITASGRWRALGGGKWKAPNDRDYYLQGRLGNGPPFKVGCDYVFCPEQDAVLWLEMRENANRLNNSGTITVVVETIPLHERDAEDATTAPSDAAQPDRAVSPFDAGQAVRHQEEWAAHLGVSVEYTNSIGMTFRLIPPGEFMMGSTPDEQARFLEVAKAAGHRGAMDRIPTESPRHPVGISRPFFLGKCEVTQGEWQAVTGKNPSRFQDPTNPVEMVSWEDIREFLAKLNEASAVDGMRYVLPTEAQWEYACRAGTGTAYCFGDDTAALGQYAWYNENSQGRPHPVGEKSPNAWGLHDMHGNMWEWCADRFGGGFYSQSPRDDPVGPQMGSDRVLRGGCWSYGVGESRSADRGGGRPGARFGYLGFRVALVPTDAP
jgi:formylglycine-generating enzyme required for sulfatase activity/serine/threonine protein kinase